MGYPEKLLTEGEEIVTEFRPHWRLLVIPVFWFIVGLALIVLVFQEWAWPDNTTADVVTGIIIGAAMVFLVIRPFVKWAFTQYVLTNERLITRSGMIARTGIEIPLENITNVVFNQGIIERLLKAGDLLIESAGESGQSRFRDIPRPDDFQSLLYRVREQRTRELAQEDSAGGPISDATERLERLARLHKEGVITDEEFAEKRQTLLDEI
jgi:uncharacterized membrane protein YdbT with pleckstrin-like domain